ncbi:TonB-dependent receptor domain-containing protein [Sphingomonas sp. MMS24-JH45]
MPAASCRCSGASMTRCSATIAAHSAIASSRSYDFGAIGTLIPLQNVYDGQLPAAQFPDHLRHQPGAEHRRASGARKHLRPVAPQSGRRAEGDGRRQSDPRVQRGLFLRRRHRIRSQASSSCPSSARRYPHVGGQRLCQLRDHLHPAGPVQPRQNRLLDPITGDNVEAGLKAELFGGRFNASAAIFQARQKHRAAGGLRCRAPARDLRGPRRQVAGDRVRILRTDRAGSPGDRRLYRPACRGRGRRAGAHLRAATPRASTSPIRRPRCRR